MRAIGHRNVWRPKFTLLNKWLMEYRADHRTAFLIARLRLRSRLKRYRLPSVIEGNVL